MWVFKWSTESLRSFLGDGPLRSWRIKPLFAKGVTPDRFPGKAYEGLRFALFLSKFDSCCLGFWSWRYC